MAKTKKEALFTSIGYGDLSDDALEIALTSAGLDGSEPFTKDDVKDIEIASIPVLESLLGITSERESQFTVTRSYEGLKMRLLLLAGRYGRKDIIDAFSSVPKISSVRGRTGRALW